METNTVSSPVAAATSPIMATTTTTASTTTTTTIASTTATATTLNTNTTATAMAAATTTNSATTTITNLSTCNNNSTNICGTGSSQNVAAISASCSSATIPLPQLLTTTTFDVTKQDDANNFSMASGISEGQRSHSGAPSASSSPILSPQGKIFGRNANGTMIATSRPNNEAEIQLYRVLQRASLLAYYDTLLEMGGDDVQQLYDAGEEEFLEIMALVGMASKPLHVRRLQKALHEWANNPSQFQSSMLPNTSGNSDCSNCSNWRQSTHISSLCETPTKPILVYNTDSTPATVLPRYKFPSFAATGNASTTGFHPTPLINTAHASPQSSATTASSLSANAPAAQLLSQLCSPAHISVPVIQPQHTPLVLTTNPTHSHSHSTPTVSQPTLLSNSMSQTSLGMVSGSAAHQHQVTSSSPQLTPVLTELQVQRITLGAEKIARQLPQREPRAQTSKKRTTRELEQVIAMSEHDPRRMEEIRKYSAIYGRFDCKRRPEKPLTLHEVCVNEAAAQLCRLVPALLTRRDELFPLARQIVKDAGFGHSASIARYGGLLSQLQSQNATRSNADCESSDSTPATVVGGMVKRQRLCSMETVSAPADLNREVLEDSRYNLFAMYQKFAKPPFDLTEIARFSLGKTDFDDNDTDSRFSFSNSSSPSMPTNGAESDRDRSSLGDETQNIAIPTCHKHAVHISDLSSSVDPSKAPSHFSGIQVISAAGSNIIAVANPALALSPTLNDVLSLNRDVSSPEVQ